MSDFTHNLLDLYLDAAPWLLLGLIVAGLIKAWLPGDRLNRWLSGGRLWSIVKAAFIGAPLPLCSCGVLPAALSIHRGGASRGATLSFMIATPETGPDSIAISYALLGPFMAVVRPVAALVSAVFTGILTLFIKEPGLPVLPLGGMNPGSCCSDGNCSTAAERPPAGFLSKTWQGLKYAFSDILDDLVLWLAVGLLLAAVVATLVPPLAMSQWGSGLSAKLLMLLVGIPIYVCATASTPVAAGLLLAGISPGTVLVFLLAGPATNIATIGVIHKEMGRTTTMIYLLGIALSSVGLGVATDFMVTALDIDIMGELESGGDAVPLWIAAGSGVVLLVAAIRPLRRKLLGQ
ncbi:permease [Thiolapillus brandeum]|uniref:Permease n=2 Tax=Thiolapillus brandeum TaxID=1076588 RepID=A0A7U6GJ36_9GAMM|nr:permease [Thiolapillus brandeum]